MKKIYLDNDWEAEYRATRKNAGSGAEEPATGLVGLTCRLSATAAGAEIHGSLNVPMVERGTTGLYFGTLQGDDLRAQLAGLIGQVVYEVFGDGVNVFTSIPRLVTGVRIP